jgi:hypothetical protein
MSGAIPPLPQYASIAWCSFKAQEQLYLLPLPYNCTFIGERVLIVHNVSCEVPRHFETNYVTLKNSGGFHKLVSIFGWNSYKLSAFCC